MRLLLLSRGGSSRLFNHGDRIICIHCFKWFEITIPFRKCVAGMAQLSCEKIARGWTRTRDPMMPPKTRPSLRPLHHNWYTNCRSLKDVDWQKTGGVGSIALNFGLLVNDIFFSRLNEVQANFSENFTTFQVGQINLHS